MAVTKFYANWEKGSEEREIINAFEGVRLRDDAVITTVPKEEGSLYDIETGLHVLPNNGRNNGKGQPYFSYYPKEDSPLKDSTSSFEYTPELNVFLQAFDGIQKFRLEGKYSDPVIPEVEIYVKHSHKLKRIPVDDDFFIVKIFLELLKTKPYSFFYKFNGVLALEFLATSKPTPSKRVALAKKGIPLFEAKAVIPNNIKRTLPPEFESEEIFKEISEQICETYSKTKYKLFGKIEKDFKTLPEYKERYEKMDNFEKQCREMEEKIKKLEKQKNDLKDEIKKLEKEIDNKKAQIEEQKEINAKYKQEHGYYEQLAKDNEQLKIRNEGLEEQNNQLNQTNAILIREKDVYLLDNKELKEQLIEEKSKQTKLSRLFMKK